MLYLVPTPVGNLEDITLRALRILKEVHLIACEDTRTSGVLLDHYGIPTPRASYHDHNERQRAPQFIARMQAGESIALITDAGTPGISDPGFYLVRACHEAGLPVVALPGPTAFVPALVASGLPAERFVFEGFLPVKKGRKTRVDALREEVRTMIFYESPHRLVKTLALLEATFGGSRPAAVAREVSKKFEEVRRGDLATLRTHYESQDKVRGELVLVVGGIGGRERREASNPDQEDD
ncbi:MAG: 16S rRNA (cytidine(1402)-2'-O)-methyltransferase [Rhodothermales bacterium]